MPITLRQLEIFEKVASSEHVTRAGEALRISQSAVSMAIAELESALGGPLFNRLGRRLLVNERGRLLLPEAQAILQRVAGIDKVLNESREPRGIFHAGASTTVGNYLLPSLVGDFANRYPNATVLLQVANTQQIEAAVASGELDLGLIEGPCHIRELDRIPWRDDELAVIVGPGHPWAGKKRVDVEMLAAAKWIMRERGSGTREVFEAAMAEKGARFAVALELGHTEAIKKAVEAGLGVGCLSRLAVQRELDNNWLVAIRAPLELRRSLTLIFRKSDYRTRLFTTFVDFLQALQ
jgi:DNA-binding transcriptional LysR family regulator